MNEKSAKQPGAAAKVPRDLPEPSDEAALEDELVEVPASDDEAPEVYPDPDEAGSGPRQGTAQDDSPAEESTPQEQPD
ncbi:hypothetical protein [Streptomyces sp. NPDC050564]|uniref:hypothetical protein n=1 Tax=Streptomyces sp. NPDC050564 TaxID=3365631 RepID=UPI0037B9260F